MHYTARAFLRSLARGKTRGLGLRFVGMNDEMLELVGWRAHERRQARRIGLACHVADDEVRRRFGLDIGLAIKAAQPAALG